MHLTLKKKETLMHAHRHRAFSGGWRCTAGGGGGGGVIVSEGAQGQTLPQGCREEEGCEEIAKPKTHARSSVLLHLAYNGGTSQERAALL